MVGILADDGAGEFAVLQLQGVAGVILQGNLCRRRFLTVQIGVRGIGHQLVTVAVHIEVACRHFGILVVEIGLFSSLRRPTRGIVRAFHLYGNLLSNIVIEVDYDGNGTITTGLLEVTEVVVPLSVVMAGFLPLVGGVSLQVDTIVEIVPRGVGVIAFRDVEVVDHHDLRLVYHLFAGGDIHRAVDNLAPHIRPDALEVGRGRPVSTGIALDIGVALVQETLLTPDELRTVPHRTAVDAHLLHHRSDTSTTGILTLVLTDQFTGHIVPAAVVIAHTIILGQTRDIGSPTDTFVIVETARMGVFI